MLYKFFCEEKQVLFEVALLHGAGELLRTNARGTGRHLVAILLKAEISIGFWLPTFL